MLGNVTLKRAWIMLISCKNSPARFLGVQESEEHLYIVRKTGGLRNDLKETYRQTGS